MTNAEAIEILSENPVAYPDQDVQSIWDEALDMAISALEKQVGEKPFWNGAFYECPNCGSSFGDNDERPMYCEICGQKILWGSDEHGTD